MAARANRASRLRRVLLLGGCILLFGAPLALVVLAPSLASVAGAAETVPPLPVAAAGASTTLNGLVDSFPVVARSFPDQQSAQAVRDFDQLGALDAGAAVQMFTDAWLGLDAPSDTNNTVSGFGTFLLTYSEPYGGDQTAFDQQVGAAMSLLTGDARNSDRLSNAAVALFVAGVASVEGAPVSGGSVATPATLIRNSIRLLIAAGQNFAPSRTVTLNLAYLLTLNAYSSFNQAVTPPVENQPDPVKDLLQPWLVAHPTDWTARHLLAAQVDLTSSVAVLGPLVANAATAALGRADLGDADMVEAQRQADQSAPGQARSLARTALDEYDRALRLSRDPGLYAGRAMALAFLGKNGAALQAQRFAVSEKPRSVDLLLGLSAIQGASGDFVGMRASARSAARLIDSGWDPLVKDVRFTPTIDPSRSVGCGESGGMAGANRGFLGYSYGSDRPHIPTWELEFSGGCGGAGFVLLSRSVPQSIDPDYQNRVAKGILADAAALRAIEASVVLGDASSADSDLRQWQAAMNDPHLAGDPAASLRSTTPTYLSARRQLIETADAAAHLVAGAQLSQLSTDPEQAVTFAQRALRDAGHFRASASICRRAADAAQPSAAPDATLWLTYLQCVGESDYLGRDYRGAQAVLSGAYQSYRNCSQCSSGMEATLLTDVVAASLQQHQDATAVQLLKPQADQSDGTAEEELGEIAVARGQTAQAIAYFSVALDTQAQIADPELVIQLAHSNRGVALLKQSQPSPDAVPDCAAHHAACLTARQDFIDALASDPGNAVYLMNLGWTERALGNGRAEASALLRATQLDPTLFPAWNDLGVLAAQSGDTVRAGQDLEQAIRSEPAYDLAVWNLGVLELGRGVSGIPRGEALLARATQLNHNLAGGALEYRTDERIYKVDVARVTTAPFNRSYSVAVTVLGSFGLAFLVLGVGGDVAKETGRKVALNFVNTRVVGPSKRVLTAALGRVPAWRALSARWPGGGDPGRLRRLVAALPWLVTLPFLALITVVVALWTNSHAQLAAIAAALLAAAIAVVAHELGHRIAARRLGYVVTPAPWPLGIAASLVMLPLKIIGGPYVGHQVTAAASDQTAGAARKKLLVIAAGPAANLLVAVVAVVLYLVEPLPILVVIALLQVGVVAFSLLPFPPMDGSEIEHTHRTSLLIFLVVMVAVASLFTAGVL